MKTLLETLKRKWAEYLLEIIVITVGILGAYSLNNWNEGRKSLKLETEMLREIKVGLESDLEDIELNLSIQRGVLKSQDIIIDWLESDQPYDDSLSIHFGRSNSTSVFLSNEGAYETLKQLGIRLITNDSLRDQILKVYDVDFQNYQVHLDAYNDMFTNMYQFINANHFSTWNMESMKPMDMAKIRFDNTYGYNFNLLRNFNQYYTDQKIVEAQKSAKKTIKMIEAELNNK